MQKIDNIEIKNFKSIRHQKIEGCKKINVFIGYPNVGKSNILEALSLFSITNKDAEISELIRFENSTTLFFNGNISEKAEIKVNGSDRIVINYVNKAVTFSNQFDTEHFGFDTIDNSGFLDRKEPMIIAHFGVSHTDKKINSFGGDGFSRKENVLARIYKYQFEKNVKYISGSSLQLSDPLGENIFDIISSNESLRKDITEIFKDYNLKFSFDKSTREFKILKDVGDDIFLISYSMIADTLHRLIFFKTAIQSNHGSILLFEEPEAHMFPPYIKKLTTDIILDKTNQFFIATHSPYVLDELILEAGDDLSVYLVDYKDGETVIHYLSSDDLSEIRQYGVDLFFNIESYLKHGQINNS